MAKKEFEKEDPFEMVQMFVDAPADDSFYEQMATTFIEEYMMFGWTDEEVLALFQDPYFQAPHGILEHKGEKYVKDLIAGVRHG